MSAPHTITSCALALFNGEDGRQRLIFNVHGGDSFAHFVLVRMRQQQDGLVAVIYLAIGQARLIGHDELDVILPGNVGER